METEQQQANTVEQVRQNNRLLTQVWLKMRRRLALGVSPEEIQCLHEGDTKVDREPTANGGRAA